MELSFGVPLLVTNTQDDIVAEEKATETATKSLPHLSKKQ